MAGGYADIKLQGEAFECISPFPNRLRAIATRIGRGIGCRKRVVCFSKYGPSKFQRV